MSLLDLIIRKIGKGVREGTRIYVNLSLSDYLDNLRNNYFKLPGYRGTFKKVREEHLKGSTYRIYFVRENVSGPYNKGEIKEINVSEERIKLAES